MTKAMVYRYRVYDVREDDYAISTRMATRTKIKQNPRGNHSGHEDGNRRQTFGGRLDGEGFCLQLAADQMHHTRSGHEGGNLPPNVYKARPPRPGSALHNPPQLARLGDCSLKCLS